jgi:hypothetical protein
LVCIEPTADYWQRIWPRDIFGSWVVVVVNLKSFIADTSDILGAILRKEKWSLMLLVAATKGRRLGRMGAGTAAGAK